jgi:hypothetical protein
MWRNSWPRGVAFCLLSCAAIAQSPARPATARFHVSGTAVDAASGQPLSGVEVTTGPAEDDDPAQDDPGQKQKTAEDGHFTFNRLKPGKYWLMAERHGYTRQNLDEHEGFSTAIAVGPNLKSDGLVFRLRPDASVSGTITDEAGEPVRDAQVMLFHDAVEDGTHSIHQRGSAGTDDLGHYHFSHVIPGRFFVAVWARPWYAQPAQGTQNVFRFGSGQNNAPAPSSPEARSPLDVAYPVTFYAGATDETGATPLELSPGDHATADVTLTAVPSVHLVIRDAVGNPNQGVAATFLRRVFDGPVITMPSQTMVHGNDIEISGAPHGLAEINLQSFGKQPARWSRKVNLTGDGEISAGQPAASQEITGVLTLDASTPPATAFVQLWDRNSGTSLGAQTGSNGEFHFDSEEMRPGNYEVRVFNLRAAVVRGVSAEGARAVGRMVRITGGGPVKLKVEATRKLCRVDGIVLRNGKPDAGAMVVLVPRNTSDSSLYRRDQSDSDGTFSLRGALPGSYSVIALSDWDTEWLNPAVLKPYLKQAKPIEVSPARRQDVEVKVQ